MHGLVMSMESVTHVSSRGICLLDSVPRVLLTVSNAPPHSLPELLLVVPPQLASLYVCWTLVIRTAQHADD